MAMAARGLSGNQAVAQEVLNNYNLGRARQDQARSFAGSVYGMGQQSAQQAMSMYGNTMLNAAQNFSPASMYANTANMSQGLGAQLFQPESQYNAGLITANRKEAMDVQIANQQASNANRLAAINAVGQIAGAAIGGGFGGFGGGLGGSIAGASTTPAQASFTSNLGNTRSSYLGQYGMGYRG
jgi:hypothetical protein